MDDAPRKRLTIQAGRRLETWGKIRRAQSDNDELIPGGPKGHEGLSLV
jgi:hypothetical protein